MEVHFFTILKLVIFILSNLFVSTAQDIHYGFCSNPQCSEPVAFGTTTMNYNAIDEGVLSFIANQEVIIFARELGFKGNLLGVMINGARGYAPKNMVKETKTLIKNLVPASVNFVQSQFATSPQHMSSHVHVSSHLHHDDGYHSMQHSHSVPNIDPHSSQHFHHNEFHLESSRQGDHVHHHAPSNDLYIVSNGDSRDHNAQRESGFFISNQVPSSHVHVNLEYSRTLNDIPSQGEMNSPDHFLQTPNSHQVVESQIQNPSGFQESNQWAGASPDHLSSSFLHGHTVQSSSQEAFSGIQTNTQNQMQPSFSQVHVPEASVQKQIQPSHSQSLMPEANVQNQMQSSNLHSHMIEANFQNQMQSSNLHSHMPEANFQNQFSHSHTSEVNVQNQKQISLSRTQETNSQNQMQFSQSVMPEANAQSQLQFPHSNTHVQENFPNQMQSPTLQSDLPEGITQSQMQPSQSSLYPLNQKYSDQEVDKTFAMLKNLGIDVEEDFTEQSTNENHQKELISSNQNFQSGHFMTDSKLISLSDVDVSSMGSSNPSGQINPSSTFYSDRDSQQMQGSEFIKSSSVVSGETEKFVPSLKRDGQNIKAKLDARVHTVLKATGVLEENDANLKNKDNTQSMSLNEGKELLNEKVEETQVDSSIPSEKEDSVPNLFLGDSTTTTPSIYDLNSNNTEILHKDSPDGNEVKSESTEVEKNTLELSESNNSTSNIHDRSGNFLEDFKEELLDDDNSEEVDDSLLDEYEDSTHGMSNSSDSATEEIEIDSEFVAKVSDESSLVNKSDTMVNESSEDMNAYQTRHLKDFENNENPIPIEENEQIDGSWEFNIYASFENSLDAIRSFIEVILPWIPDPLYTIITDLEKEGISPKVPVFTILSAVPCIILMVLLVYVKEKSKEKKLIAQLTISEKTLYNLKAEKNIFEEKLEKAEIELQILRTLIEEEKLVSAQLKAEVDSLKEQGEEANIEIDKSIDTIEALKERELQYVQLVKDHEKEHLNLLKQKTGIENSLSEQKNTISNLTEQLDEKNTEIQKLLEEKSEGNKTLEDYQEKLTLLQQNCNQLLQEAEVWNLRVKELSEKLSEESSIKGELEESLKEKDNELEALKEAVQVFKSFEEIGKDEEEDKSIEEKLQYIINSTSILIKLQKQEESNRLLSERLTEEKNKLLDMEVVILDVKSENDKLRLNYNQALQDKAEAQTKLDVLTNYFKDKEIQLQKQLGVQEAVRQKTEEDASSAERRICLIEQENASYKYQVATMKQEMEETERNLKSQIATQEKKAHENWLAARTSERKLEDTKQEVTQLRQRLTLLEREQENWLNSARDEIIRPVPKRVANANDDTILTQDSNSSLELRPPMFPPPPMMLPSDRPLPPLPPLPPPYLPPFEPPPPHFRPQPWLPPPDSISNSEYRMTPEFGRGRELTPPRGRNSVGVDGDSGPRQSSPITDMRDSRNSTPPHLLPDFHDIPPHPPRPPFFPPMGPRTRFPPPPGVFRRDHIQGQRRHENQDDNPNYGSQHPTGPPENWRNPRV